MSGPERRLPPLRTAYRWFTPMPTRWGDNDVFGHVNNVVYYAYYDTAIGRYLIHECGFDPQASPVLDFAVESLNRFHRSVTFPHLLEVGLRIAHLGSSSIRWEGAVFRENEADAAADGYFVHVIVDRATQRPTAIPANLRAGLSRILAAGE